MAHNVSISFNPIKEAELLEAIQDKPSTRVKECIRFWLKYKDLIPELDNTDDLLTVVSQMAAKQGELIALVSRLSERINGLQAITVSDVVSDENGYDDMMEFE